MRKLGKEGGTSLFRSPFAFQKECAASAETLKRERGREQEAKRSVSTKLLKEEEKGEDSKRGILE